MEESLRVFSRIAEKFELSEVDINTYSPLTLAYIGDAIYEIVIRTYIVAHGNSQVNKLHKRTSELVKAKTQCEMMEVIEPMLNEQELSVYKRGRNAKSTSMAKNASMHEYRTATGFEALMGYLYMSGEEARMMEMIKTAIDYVRNGV